MHRRRRRRQPNPQNDTVQLSARAALPFAVLLSLFSGAHGIAAKLGWGKSEVTASGRRRIPFAPSVAAALIGTFMLRSLQLVSIRLRQLAAAHPFAPLIGS
jgi:hypothetical protein